MKKRTSLLNYLYSIVEFPNTVCLNYNTYNIEIYIKDSNCKDVVLLNVNMIDDDIITLNFSFQREISSIYKNFPCIAKANDYVVLIEKWNSAY